MMQKGRPGRRHRLERSLVVGHDSVRLTVRRARGAKGKPRQVFPPSHIVPRMYKLKACLLMGGSPEQANGIQPVRPPDYLDSLTAVVGLQTNNVFSHS